MGTTTVHDFKEGDRVICKERMPNDHSIIIDNEYTIKQVGVTILSLKEIRGVYLIKHFVKAPNKDIKDIIKEFLTT